MGNENLSKLWDMAILTIRELETEKGIMASGKEEIYGCIFGRDTLITSLKLLKVYKRTQDEYFLKLVKKALENLALLQGTEINIESGEQPGKCIHEYRLNNHEHLTKKNFEPWYIYADDSMKNYDSVDSTPLFLIAVYEYFQITQDQIFLNEILPSVTSSLNWILNYSDSNNDGFVDYGLHPQRIFGGLKTQSWMDSHDSIFHEDETEVVYPIAPAEVQSYVYTALVNWGTFLQTNDGQFSNKLINFAKKLKRNFNKKFISRVNGEFTLAFAIDGNGKALISPRSTMGHCIWKERGILNKKHIKPLVNRLMKADLFEPNAGVRTLSVNSKNFRPNSYHNGSIWPHDTAIIIEGLENSGFSEKASVMRQALLNSYTHFQTPLELFVFENGKFVDYCGENGQKSCQKQAWSAASLLSILSPLISDYETATQHVSEVAQ